MTRLMFAALLPLVSLAAAPLAAEEGERPGYGEMTAATAPIADAYFAAYTGRDWYRLEALAADDASFEDPTATYVFGGVASAGRTAMMERFRVGYAGITHMEFETARRFVSGDLAIYEGELDWGLDLGDGTLVSSVTPMVIILTVENGKVVKHRDYVDYAPFNAAVKAARGA
ncbi:nuclear transport factor 2 family protein [Altererythrobacter arenosus]|uniref:Nuclear transport factor 2 family protein n=1 Tax=Altererythrobacter arenosus TaxID=3032592 RepID=A0ABY8FS57_9SPHN|nr:nuclear transport factor 2 family protein [Altererythrobacter sp. CAU 1644]WFL76246.1 nuclear transport factor 2 family protein [Altererythrobacter sp. CAU 1644]